MDNKRSKDFQFKYLHNFMNLSYLCNFPINNLKSSRLINLWDLSRLLIFKNLNLPNLQVPKFDLKSYLRVNKQNLIEIFIHLHIITIKLYLYNWLANIKDLHHLKHFTDQLYFKLIGHSYPSHFQAVKFHQAYTFMDNIRSINQRWLTKLLTPFVLNHHNSFLNILM